MSLGPPPQVLDLEPAAATLLDLLVELGHLDDRMLQLVNDRLLDLEGSTDPQGARAVTLADVKRVAAGVIDDHLVETDLEYQRAVEREWPLLFY
jgi:hypothetical protein